MNIKTYLTKTIRQSNQAKKTLMSQIKAINDAINILYECLIDDKKIFICGNGGSAADAQHLSAEFLVRLKPSVNRRPLPLISLAMDTSTITACSNDFNFKYLFSRNLEALGSSGDILIILSTSGNSKNIIEVAKLANSKKIKTIGFLGKNGGLVKKHTNIPIIVKNNDVARIQEAHIMLGHFILESVEKKIIKKF